MREALRMTDSMERVLEPSSLGMTEYLVYP
jgi:hypothetical protein